MRNEPVSISVVIAVYNMKTHIRQCIHSVLNQTMQDWELILVDDVSTDGTAEILKEYAQKDDRIHVVWQEHNGGAQVARNAGVAVSRGKYITIMDHDDFLSSDALQQALETFLAHDNLQCVCLHEKRLHPDGTVTDSAVQNSFGMISGIEAYRRSVNWKAITGRMVVTRELQMQYPFDNCERVYGEDNTAQLQFLASPQVCSCEGVYYHRLLDTSLSHCVSLNNIRGNIRFLAMREHLLQGNFPTEVMNINETSFWESIIASYHYYWIHRQQFSQTDRDEALGIIRKLRKQADMSMVRLGCKLRPGFMYMPAWWLFRLQLESYLCIKKLCGLI